MKPTFTQSIQTFASFSHVMQGVFAMLTVGILLTLQACGPKEEYEPPTLVEPAPTYTGPEQLHGSIGSLTSIAGYAPRLVSGFGLVVNLNGTGSSDVPPALRGWLLNELARRGFGQESVGAGDLTPEEVLASDRTAIVAVQGIIPPAAVKQTTFDLVVHALPQTTTTSLQGGILYTTELRPGGINLNQPRARHIALGRGPTFVNPFAGEAPTLEQGGDTLQRRARVLGGGVVVNDMPITLNLNNPSYAQSRLIADRINAVFTKGPRDPAPMAEPFNDRLIRLNVLHRFRNNPDQMILLLSHIFLNPTEAYAMRKAQELERMLRQPDQAEFAPRVATAWQVMGKTMLPYLRNLYEDPNMTVRLSALQAGSRLDDVRTIEPLYALASGADAELRDRATDLLGEMLAESPNNPQLREMLRNLLSSPDAIVRMSAFHALKGIDQQAITYRWFPEKMDLAIVESDQPMIYVTRSGKPMIVIFGKNLPIDTDVLFTLWENQLMIRGNAPQKQTLSLRYRPVGQSAEVIEIAPTVGNLVFALAQAPQQPRDPKGFDLPYSPIVKVLFDLIQAGHIDAPLVLQQSDLPQRIESFEQRQQRLRPDTPAPAPGSTAPGSAAPGNEVPGSAATPDNTMQNDTPSPAPRPE